MPIIRAGQLARQVPAVRREDSLALAAENLRAGGAGALPVVDGPLGDSQVAPRVVGLIDERSLAAPVLPLLARAEQAAYLAAAGEISAGGEAGALLPEVSTADIPEEPSAAAFPPHPNGQDPAAGARAAVRELRAADVMERDIGVIPAAFTLHNALLALERHQALALPVVDGEGNYRGMLSRADIIAALGGQLRPPLVGGMATPRGVWLTTGNLGAGVSGSSLFLSGVVTGLMIYASQLLVLAGLSSLDGTLALMFMSGRAQPLLPNGMQWNLMFQVLQGACFLGLFRLLPMAGYHAAEHQTVWALERGVPLTVETVRRMPRAHPRCGTNLLVLASLILIVFQHLPEFDPGLIVAMLLVIYLLWRPLGDWVQLVFTTRPATDHQLESGIRAARELLEKYQEEPRLPAGVGLRLYNSGLLPASLGIVACSLLLEPLQRWVAQWLLGI